MFFVSIRIMQEARVNLKEVNDGLKRMLNTIHKETEESITLAWKDLEAERDQL